MNLHDYSNEVHPLRSRAARWTLIAAGTVLVGVGVLGVILPVLPGTPFLLLAAACYARASDRFYNALLNNRVVGPTIVQWRHSKSMPLQAKVSAIGLVVLAFGITAGWVLEHPWARAGMVLIAIGIIAFILRVPTRPAAILRQALDADIPHMQRVRGIVRENVLSDPALVTDQMYRDHLHDLGRGWVYEVRGSVVGFAIANLRNGTIWALFVDPRWERRGIGRALHDTMLDWLRSRGAPKVQLGTAPGTRAARFYEAAGWSFQGLDARGEAIYEKTLS